MSDFETNYLYHKNPHQNMTKRICNAGTKFSLIIELNTENNLKNTIWFAPLNPCIHPYIPIVYNVAAIPLSYQNRPLNQTLKFHFDKKSNTIEASSTSAYNIFNFYNKSINNDYKKNITTAATWKQKFENDAFKTFLNSNDKVKTSEALLLKLYNSEKQFNATRK